MRIDKYHGLGNDYLVVSTDVTPEAVRALCDRHRGVGADGVLQVRPVPEGVDADVWVTIWNPDGSTAEKSGNGLRILARWLVDSGRLPAMGQRLWTGQCLATADVFADRVVVDMGRATFEPADIPLDSEGGWLEHALKLAGQEVRVSALSVGNPHAVIFVERPLEEVPWRDWGAELECHAQFSRRTNVQVARVIGTAEVDIRIWERGAGPTLASGSSSCAVVAAGVRTGRLKPGRITVRMPGGVLMVHCSPNLDLRLEGPVALCWRGEVEVAGV